MSIEQFRDVNIIVDTANYREYRKIFVSQGDYDGRSLTVQITDNGLVKEQPGLQVNLWWKHKVAGNQGLDNFTLINKEESIFKIDFPNVMLTPGTVIVALQILIDGRIIMTREFEIEVQELYGSAYAVIKENSFSTLTNALAESNKWFSELEKKPDLETVKEMMSTLPTGTPKETFTSLAALKQKYPSGDDSAMIVLDASGAGYVYTWNGTDWAKGPLYQAAGVADKTITRSKTTYSTYNALQAILGNVNIDSKTQKVSCSKNLSMAYGSGYRYPNTEQEVDLPPGNGPTFIGFVGTKLIATKGSELETPDATLVAVYYQEKIYAYDYRNVSFNGILLDNMNNSEGTVTFGNVKIYFDEKKVIIEKGTVVTSNRGNFHFAVDGDVELTYENDTPSLYLVANKRSQEFELTSSIFPESQIILGSLYRGRFYKSSPKSRITSYPLDDVEFAGSLSYIDFGTKIEITDNDSTKTIKIPVGQTPIDNRSGLFYRNDKEFLIDFSEYVASNGSVMSLFLQPSLFKSEIGRYYAANYYVDFSPRNLDDIKVFSYYKNKVYGTDDVTRSMITVNGVGNGGFDNETTDKLKLHSLKEWFSKISGGSASKIVWIGDSTWATRTNTVPFATKIQPLLDEYFGSGKVTSINESIGGQTINYFAKNIEDILNRNSPIDVVFIGACLNGVFESNIESRKESFEIIVNACLDKGVLPVIGTAQAHQVPNVETGDDWSDRSQFFIEKFDRPLRFAIAKKYNLDLIDFTNFSQMILDNAPESISALVPDGLHGSQKLHDYQTEWLFSELIPTIKKINTNGIVKMYDQFVYSNKSKKYIKDIVRDENGFKSQWDYEAANDDLLMDAWIYLSPENFAAWNIFASSPLGTIIVNINGVEHQVTSSEKQVLLSETACGLYHVKVTAKAGAIKFKGLIVETSKN
ncbi:SGNH/GDSL hydrolase family protein [Enterococcus faecalis]|uniref:SGNH/GDSL hydrolase family protein n=1 Tax=Enterococcus faecalis TaxID=1351 RepID=UPI00257E82C6|nr:SGNH/GDSL hydrolase family protein [Enterococcus faecalis]